MRRAVLHLEDGVTFTIEARNQHPANVYVASVVLNGSRLDRRYITHDEIMSGGTLEFIMSENPAK